MENISKALLMAFSMLIFVIAFSYSMFLINKITTTSNTLLESVTTTNYYDNLKVSGDQTTTRQVGIETIIPTLYRYYKENYAVKIYDTSENLIQTFDITTERDVRRAASYTTTENTPSADKKLISLRKSIYNAKKEDGTGKNRAYLFQAPWTGTTDQDMRTRIDYFLNGTKGYINNTLVDYSESGPTFTEKRWFYRIL